MFENHLLLAAYQEEREQQVRKHLRQNQLLAEARKNAPSRGVARRLRYVTGGVLISAGRRLQSRPVREIVSHG